MQPSSPTSAASSSPPPLPAAELNTADRELLIDIDFFDAKGRWNPRHVVFCAAEDGARAKSLWTRCFRGFMALHGKLWAKNYLDNRFSDRAESEQLIKQIKQAGYVDKKIFQSTVAHCTLLYENLNTTSSKKTVDQHRIVPASPIEDIDNIVEQHFVQIDWSEWKNEAQFKRLTLDLAHNIQKIFSELKITPANDLVAEQFRECLNFFDDLLDVCVPKSEAHQSMIDQVLAAKDEIDYKKREEIVNLMFKAVDDYIIRSEDQKILNDRITAKQIFNQG